MMESESNSLSNNNDKTFTIFINIKNIFKEYFDEYQNTAFADDQNE